MVEGALKIVFIGTINSFNRSVPGDVVDIEEQQQLDAQFEEEEDEDEEELVPKMNRKTERKRWTDVEVNELHRYFKDFLKSMFYVHVT